MNAIFVPCMVLSYDDGVPYKNLLTQLIATLLLIMVGHCIFGNPQTLKYCLFWFCHHPTPPKYHNRKTPSSTVQATAFHLSAITYHKKMTGKLNPFHSSALLRPKTKLKITYPLEYPDSICSPNCYCQFNS